MTDQVGDFSGFGSDAKQRSCGLTQEILSYQQERLCTRSSGRLVCLRCHQGISAHVIGPMCHVCWKRFHTRDLRAHLNEKHPVQLSGRVFL